jgi:hypothetical protein
MDITNGGGVPCAVIDDTANHDCESTYYVALCVEGLYIGYPVGSFTFDVLYDDLLNKVPDVANVKPALDDNPDGNVGGTTWPTGDIGLGPTAYWDCSANGASYPEGDIQPATGDQNGDAYITCESGDGPWNLGDNETHGVLAVIEFRAIAEGDDAMTIATSGYIANPDVSKYGECTGTSYPMGCVGGVAHNEGEAVATNTPTPTATPAPTRCPNDICPTSEPTRKAWTKTPTPTVTATPAPTEPSGPSEPQQPPPPPTGGQLPQVVPPGTGSGPDGVPWASTAVWLLAAAGAVSVSLGGLYVRRVRRR